MNFNKFYFPLLCLGLLFTFNACVNQQFDEPPAQVASILEANTTIADLKATHVSGAFELIEEDIIIEGVVISSDEFGNFYKELVIQDETGGLELSIDATNLYADYPVGRRVYVKCQGMTMGDGVALGSGAIDDDNDGTPDFLARIEENLIAEYIEKGERDQALPVQMITINDVSQSINLTMVQLDDVEFASSDAGLTYANPAGTFAENRYLNDCDENELIVRTSDYSDFAGASTPVGNGTITGVLSYFGNTPQLFINNTDGVDMTADRCDGSGGGGGGNGGGDPTGNELLNEGFDGTTQYEVIDLADWYNIAEVGSDPERWFGNEFNGNKYAEASAFQSEDSENVIWLISKAIDLSEASSINFESAQHHWAHDGFSVWISDDFDGSNVADASWIEVDCALPTATDDWYAMIPSGNINLTDYISSGSVYVGFRYEGTSGGNTTGFQLDNVVIK